MSSEQHQNLIELFRNGVSKEDCQKICDEWENLTGSKSYADCLRMIFGVSPPKIGGNQMVSSPVGSIWKPTTDIPDVAYCACLMLHSAEMIEHNFAEFQYELAVNRNLYRNAFAVLWSYLKDQGFDPKMITI